MWFYLSARPQGRCDSPTHVSAAASVATRSQPRRENPETTRNLYTSNTSARRQSAGGSLKYPPTGPLLTPSCAFVLLCVSMYICEDETRQKKKFNPVSKSFASEAAKLASRVVQYVVFLKRHSCNFIPSEQRNALS